MVPLLLTSCGGGDSNSSGGGLTSLKNISATAGSYGKAIFLGEGATPSPLTGLNPTDANTSYVSADEDICTVDNSTGAVTGVKEGECRLTLTLSKAGYNDKVIEYILPVVLSVNDFKGKELFNGSYLGSYTRPVFADVDGDGDRDLVVGLGNGSLKYYRKNSKDAPTLLTEMTGTENPFKNINVRNYSAPTFADINGDGDLDLVMGGIEGTLKYFLNESTTESVIFTEKTSTENPFNNIDIGGYSVPTFADVDGDNDLDLVVGERGGTLKYFLNESTSSTITFTEKTGSTDNPFDGIDVGYYSTLTFAYIDGDNKIDLVVGETRGTLKYFLNESTTSTITFTEKTSSTDNPFYGLDIGGASKPSFDDFDGDGKLDLVLGRSGGNLAFYLNESTTSSIIFTSKTISKNPFGGFDAGYYAVPTIADIDGDSDLDLVVGESEGNLKYLLNESTENTVSFTEKTGNTDNPFNVFDVGKNSVPTFADVDGDNDLDLVVGESEGTLKYFLNESTTNTITFTEKTSTDNPFNGLDAGLRSSPTFIDIDGDNDFDLVMSESRGTLKFYLNESTTNSITFTPKTGTDNPFNGFDAGNYSIPTFIDIDRDGDFDLIVGTYNGTLAFYLNESTTNSIAFTPKTGTDNPFNLINFGSASYFAPTFIDIDRDGDLDLLAGASGGEIYTIINHFGHWVTFTAF